MAKTQHVTPKGDQWQVKGEGNKKATVITKTQKEAIEKAKQIAKNNDTGVVIHRPTGKIRDNSTYNKGNKPKKK